MVLTETMILGIVKMVKVALQHNMKLMEIDPDLALAGLRRLEKIIDTIEKVIHIELDGD